VSSPRPRFIIRNTQPGDFAGIIKLTREIYPGSPPWTEVQLASHLTVFPEGQLVAVEVDGGRVAGMAASLILRWDDYEMDMAWRDFTANGTFGNHDPNGRTLYGAEVMVGTSLQRHGIGRRLYVARRKLVERLGLLRIRAGARLRGYWRHARQLSAEQYVVEVVRGRLKDPTLSFQLANGFEVLAVVSGYLHMDPESLGYAAVIEWLNTRMARPQDYAGRNPRYLTGVLRT